MNINFDKIIDRTNRGARKVDYPLQCGEQKDTIQMWIADMDFETAPCVKDALKDLVDYGVFGYTDFDKKYFDAVISWFKKRYNYELKSEEIVRTPGVIFALAMAVKAFSRENESVLIFNPEYGAFREVTVLNNRKVVESNLKLENNKYYIDFEDLEKKIKENDVKILMFCNPFNPCGRVWTKDELIKVARICVDNKVIIVSDEIHMDFVWGDHRHIIFLDALKDDMALYENASKLTIINTSVSKTFNLAGLQAANTIIKDKNLREKVEAEIGKTGYHRISQTAQVALMAAYTDSGYEWLCELKKYIYENILYVKDYINKNIPKLEVIDTEGTYLMWIDFRKYGLSDDELQKKLINEAKVHLDNGLKFGSLGDGFMRMNVATSRINIEKALINIKKRLINVWVEYSKHERKIMGEKLSLPEKFEEFSDARKNGFLKVKALKEEGKLVAGIFCTFTPLEILDAAGFVSVSLCGMSAETIPDAEVDLPKNLCPLIKSSYGFYVSDKCPYTYFSDLIVGETTCDGKKKMYELMAKGKKTFILHLPQSEEEFEVDAWEKELNRFKEYLEKEFGVEITEEKLRDAAKLRNIERTERRKLMEVQLTNPAPASGLDLYKTFDGVGFLFDEQERIDKLKGLREEIEKSGDANLNKGKKRILVTGCPIGGVLDKTVGAIEKSNGNVVCYENCAGLKAGLRLVDEKSNNMIRAIATRYLSIGCAVMTPDTTRMNNLKELVKEYQIDGVINVTLHACTTYDVESKIVADLMKEIGMPYMSVECDYTAGDEGQLLTRIQAFIEMLK